MRSLGHVLFALGASLFTICACGEARIGEGAVENANDDVSFRSSCGYPFCNGWNTNVVGEHDVSNVPLVFNTWANNANGALMVIGATVYHDSSLRTVTRWEVTPSGELEVFYASAIGPEVKVSGHDVEGTDFTIEINPDQGANYEAHLKVHQVYSYPGKYYSAETVFAYDIITDVEPFDTEQFPEVVVSSDWYHTCPNSNDGGLLAGHEMFSVVLAKNTELDGSVNPPSVELNEDRVLFACKNGAVGKSQDQLNVYYDHHFDPHPRALAPSQLTAIMLAWTAWHNSESTTKPGMLVCFDDPIGALFSGDCFKEVEFEAAYGAYGASCANGDGPGGKGVHRRFEEPEDNIVGWDALPDCEDSSYYLAVNPDENVIGVFTLPGVDDGQDP